MKRKMSFSIIRKIKKRIKFYHKTMSKKKIFQFKTESDPIQLVFV